MTRALTLLLILLVSVALMVSGFVQASAGVRTASATPVVICAGSGPRHILLDHNGNPVEPTSDCCKCAGCHLSVSHLPSRVILRPRLSRGAQSGTGFFTAWLPWPVRTLRPPLRAPPSQPGFQAPRRPQNQHTSGAEKFSLLEFRQESAPRDMSCHGQNPKVFP